MRTFTFHLLGLAHLPTIKKYSSCAYTQKIIKLSSMLMGLGHDVRFYGVEGSDVECTEFIPVVSQETWQSEFGNHDYKTGFFKEDSEKANNEFNENCILEINTRKKDKDFLLCTMGIRHKYIADSVGLMAVESGIGYEGIFSDKKVFESYAWMHYMYGKKGIDNGNWYDCVIPNYFIPSEFDFVTKKEDYFLFVGRIIQRKGIDIACQVTEKLGKKLVIAGQGSLVNEREKLDLSGYKNIEYVGVVEQKERSKLMGGAIACFTPTYYIEPFGGVAVESMFCGTPVITTDWGAYTETVLHGKTGYRCRTFEEFVWSARQCMNYEINPYDCRVWALDNYCMFECAKMYQEYFERLYNLYDKGWYQENEYRQDLSYLEKNYV